MDIEIGKTYLVANLDGTLGENLVPVGPSTIIAKTDANLYIGLRDCGWRITNGLAQELDIPQKYIGQCAWFYSKNNIIDLIHEKG